MTSLVLTLPLPVTKNKDAGHWRSVLKATNAYYKLLDHFWMVEERLGRVVAPARPWVALTASAVCYPRGLIDEGNLMARLKPLEDWIVNKGIVVDDSPLHWHWLAMPQQIPQRKHPAYLILTLQRCDGVHPLQHAGAA